MFQCEQQWPDRPRPPLGWEGAAIMLAGGGQNLASSRQQKVALQHQVMNLDRVFTLHSTWRTSSLGPGLIPLARSLHLISIFFLPWSWP